MSLLLCNENGVINEGSTANIKRSSDRLPIPRHLEAHAPFNRAGSIVAIRTSQAGIARGQVSDGDLTAINRRMLAEIRNIRIHIDEILCCIRAPEERCSRPKPVPSLLMHAMHDLSEPPDETADVADSSRHTETTARAVKATRTFDCPSCPVDWLLAR